jgi:hypothetical protein
MKFTQPLYDVNLLKNKAVQRAGDIREHRKAKKRYLETIVKLKEQIILMEQVSGGKKTV